MAQTFVDLTGNQGTGTGGKTFSFNFPYLESSHIKVEINGVNSTAFTVQASPSAVILTNTPAATDKIRIRRDSNASLAQVDFEDGSVLVETDLDKAYLHNLYLNEEIGELNDLSLQKASGSDDWDAKGNKIINVGTPAASDGISTAATKEYVDDNIHLAAAGIKSEPLKYTFTGSTGVTEFTFPSNITLNKDTVYDVNVDGVFQEPKAGTSDGDFSIDATNNKITFTTAPANNSRIVVIVRGYSQEVGEGSVTEDNLAENSVTAIKIADGVINNSKISTTANIALTKLESVNSGNIIVGNASNKAASVTPSGDISVSNTGQLNIKDGAVDNAAVATNAAIAHSKLANLDSKGVLGSTVDEGGGVSIVGFGAVSGNSNTSISTAQQIKTYVDAQVKDTLDEIGEQTSSPPLNTDKKHFTKGEKDKLADIETDADVTDTTNVVAALTAGNNITIAADGTITASGVDDNSITAAKISDTDGQFLVDDGTTKKVVVNNAAADVDFTVKGNSGNLIQTDASTSQVGINGAPFLVTGSPTNYYDLTVHGETLIKESQNGALAQLTIENTQTSGNPTAILVIQAKESAKIRLHDMDATSGVDMYDIASENGELKFGALDSEQDEGVDLFKVSKQTFTINNQETSKTIINMSGLPDANQLSSLQTGDLYQDSGTVKIKT